MAVDTKRKFKLGELLVNDGRLTQEQVDSALKRSRDSGTMLGATLVEMNLIKAVELLRIVRNWLEASLRGVTRRAD